jgi:mono/diheme cytochrome c family protein
MTPLRAIRFAAIGFGIGIAALACTFAYAWLLSETIIQRHYPLFSMDVYYKTDVATLARGKHLLKLTGCADCHSDNLHGALNKPYPWFPIWAPNLTRSLRTLNDEQFARAIRFGVHPDGTSLWVMPSADYMYLSDADLSAMIAYLHALPAAGRTTPAPVFKKIARLAVLRGDLAPAALDMTRTESSLDLGPRYQGGRYLARVSCALCHELDLTGTPDGRVPNLTIVRRYRSADLFGLLREGKSQGHNPVPVHAALARARFSDFRDYEVMALYDYLWARANALPPDGR